MPTYGITPAGFFLKPVTQIVQDLDDACQAQIDAALDVSTPSPQGQLNGVFGAAVGDVWALAQVAFNEFNPDDVEGSLQNNLGQLSGILRLNTQVSSCYCSVALAAGTYAAGSLVATVANPGGPPMANGAPNPSIGQQFSNANQITIGIGQLNQFGQVGADNVLFVALNPGPIICPGSSTGLPGNGPTPNPPFPGWLCTIATPVTGWSGVSNTTDALIGNVLEADTDYRVRREKQLGATSASQVDQIRAAILAIPYVIGCNVIENRTMAVQPITGLPPKSFQAVVYANSFVDWSSVAQTIWNNKPAGMQPYGNTFQLVRDSQGNFQPLYYTQVQPVSLAMIFTVAFFPNVSSADKSGIAAQLRQTAVQLSLGYDYAGNPLPTGTPGVLTPGSIVYAQAYKIMPLSIGGVDDVQSLLLSVAPITAPTSPPTPTSPSNITTIDPQHIGSLATANITVIDALTGTAIT